MKELAIAYLVIGAFMTILFMIAMKSKNNLRDSNHHNLS